MTLLFSLVKGTVVVVVVVVGLRAEEGWSKQRNGDVTGNTTREADRVVRVKVQQARRPVPPRVRRRTARPGPQVGPPCQRRSR